MGESDALKREAGRKHWKAAGLLAFGVSEREHGSDLLGNEFSIHQVADGRWVANGSKYYIGNCNIASIVATLARKESERTANPARRAPVALVAHCDHLNQLATA